MLKLATKFIPDNFDMLTLQANSMIVTHSTIVFVSRLSIVTPSSIVSVSSTLIVVV